jgi:hypothetical protein
MENPVLISKSTRWWDWSAVLLLAGALIIAAIRLNSTGWTHELDLIQTVVVLGVIAGLALGKSSFSRGVARFFALVYGLFVIGWQVGLTLGKGVLWPERMISMGNRLLITLDQIKTRNRQPVFQSSHGQLILGIGCLCWLQPYSAWKCMASHPPDRHRPDNHPGL